MLDALQAAASAAGRWLALGRDVVVRGDTGSGRSAVLGMVARESERTRPGTVRIDWHDLTGRPARPGTRSRAASSLDQVVDDLVADLGPRGALLVDDVDQLEETTLDVLDRVLRRTGARFVAATTRDVVRAGHPFSRLIGARAPAEVRVAPLGYQAMARLIASRLSGPPDAALVSSVMAWSAGNPAVAVALLDAARFAGVVERRNGTWTVTGDLEQVPLDAVAHLMVSGLPEEAVDAIEVLSVLGPARIDVARRFVPESALTLLARRNRVVSYSGDGGELLAVSPPALARSVRARLTEPRRLEVAQRVVTELGGRELPLPSTRTELTEMILASSGEPAEAYWRWTAELTGLVHERAVVVEASARTAWEENPVVRTAVPYLVALLRRPTTARVGDVLAGTTRSSDDDTGMVELFDALRHSWQVWQRDPDAGAASVLAAVPDLAAVPGPGDAEPGSDPAAGLTEPRRSAAQARAASELVARGRLADALRLTEHTAVPPWMPEELGHALTGLRSLALLLDDRVADAETFARAQLEAAYDSLDLAGIRVHTAALAEVLTVRGQWAAAWRVLSTSLRLGPPGPLGSAFHRRTLMLATVLASLVENADVAQMLLAELERARPLHEPVVDSMQAVAEAAVLVSAGHESQADAVLWRAGARALAAGEPLPALEYWVRRTGPSTADQLARMRSIARETPVPLLEPVVGVHEALHHGDADDLAGAVRAARLEMVPGLVPRILSVLAERRRRAGLPALSEVETEDLLGHPLAQRARSRSPRSTESAAAATLSDRERQVAVLAAEGLTNREIAEQLHLSPRTVENHVHRALRKQGLTSRTRLAETVL